MADSIYHMVLRDFRAFPAMWSGYLDRNLEKTSPIRAVAEALSRNDTEDASKEYAELASALRDAPRGQIARAMIDFAKGAELHHRPL